MSEVTLKPRALNLSAPARGFTLIELLIAVAIVAILSAVAYPAYTSQIAKGKRNECRAGLLQSMQQQERYFSQFNKYVTFTAGATTAKTKAFSGDSLSASACAISAQSCLKADSTAEDLTVCVELRAEPRTTFSEPGWTYIGLDSYGAKSCKIGGTTHAGSNPNPSGERICWP